MSQELTNQAVTPRANQRCPECQANGHDTGTDAGHLFLMADGNKWCCNHTHWHSNKTYYFAACDSDGNPVHNRKENTDTSVSIPEKPVAEQEEKEHTDSPFGETSAPASTESDLGEPNTFRGIPKEVYEKYGCKMKFSAVDRSVQQVYYPTFEGGKQVAWKVREVEDKKFYVVPLDR